MKSDSPLTIGNFILDVRENMAGVEMASAIRSRILTGILNHRTLYFTTVYNRSLKANIEKYKSIKRFDESIEVINIWDYYQTASTLVKKNLISDLQFKIDRVEETQDYRGFDEQGKFIAFVKVNTSNPDEIDFINYLESGKPFRRDHFHSDGYLSKTELIENNDSGDLKEIIYNSAGVPVIIQSSRILEKKYHLNYIQLHDSEGRFISTFDTTKEFNLYWFKEVAEKYQLDIALIDRVAEFFEPILSVQADIRPKMKVIPVVHSGHTQGHPMVSGLSNFYEGPLKSLNKLDNLIVLTASQASDIAARFSDGNISIIPHGHSIKWGSNSDAAPSSEKSGEFTIVHVARFTAEKRHKLALDMFSKVAERIPNVKLDLYGFGALDKEIEKQITDLGLQQKVRIKGFVEDVNKVFAEADVSIMTSRVEGFCLAIQESLANGCPVVAFDVKYGPSDMINNAQNGFLIEDENIEQMSDKICHILQNKKLSESLRQNALILSKSTAEIEVSRSWGDLFRSLFD